MMGGAAARLSVLLLTLLTAGAASAQTLETLLSNGPTAARINVVIVAEGYTVGQQANFSRDARRLLDALLATPPYSEYASYFNGFALFVASSESGSNHPSLGVYRNTYFGTYYDCAGLRRLICMSPVGMSLMSALLQDHMPEYDIVLLVVNDREYGGSGGSVAIASAHSYSAEIAIHEIGHSFAKLADEYGGTGMGFESLNTTAHTRRENVRWRHWIGPAAPLPTPSIPEFAEVVGLFEGAAYSDTGWYRPQHTCKMRSLGVPFCAVCYEHHVGAMYELLSPLASAWPAGRTVEVDEEVTLTVETLVPRSWATVEWRVGGELIPDARGNTLTLRAEDLEVGRTAVSARVRDTNVRVLSPDLLPLLEDSAEWAVVREAATHAEPGPPPAPALAQNRPNPFRGATTFSFRVPAPGPVRLVVYDVLGREVATVFDGVAGTAEQGVEWSAALPAGLYVYRLHGQGYALARTLVILP